MMRAGRWLQASLALVTALAAARGAGAWRLEDSLRGSTRGNLVGGSIQGDGWHVTARTDRVWYALPRLVSGSVEFTLTGLTMDRLGSTFDNEIFAMYEAGYGISEPISYSQFRVNHYKCMLRIYGNAETGREGQQKLMWGMCPGGAPGYDGCSCGRAFFQEPFGGDGRWDGTPQRLRIEWRNGVTRYLRNGTQVVSIDWSRSGLTFGPQSLHLSLGTSRPSAVDTAQLPVGIVFSDLLIEGDEGPMAVCPGASVMDAGAPTDVPPLPANTLEFPAVEDVTVAPSLPAAVYADVNDLSVGANDSEFYLKFRVGGLPGRVVRAQLVLRSSAYSSAVGDGASVFLARRDDWSESTLTWNARPGPLGARLARIQGVREDTLYAVDLPTGVIQSPGVYAFAVLPEASDDDSAHFDARERAPGRGPVLRLTVDPTLPPLDAGAPAIDARSPLTDVVTARDAGAPNDLATPADVVTARDAGPPPTADLGAPSDLPVTGACGCRARRRSNHTFGWLVAVALLARRRRGAGW